MFRSAVNVEEMSTTCLLSRFGKISECFGRVFSSSNYYSRSLIKEARWFKSKIHRFLLFGRKSRYCFVYSALVFATSDRNDRFRISREQYTLAGVTTESYKSFRWYITPFWHAWQTDG